MRSSLLSPGIGLRVGERGCCLQYSNSKNRSGKNWHFCNPVHCCLIPLWVYILYPREKNWTLTGADGLPFFLLNFRKLLLSLIWCKRLRSSVFFPKSSLLLKRKHRQLILLLWKPNLMPKILSCRASFQSHIIFLSNPTRLSEYHHARFWWQLPSANSFFMLPEQLIKKKKILERQILLFSCRNIGQALSLMLHCAEVWDVCVRDYWGRVPWLYKAGSNEEQQGGDILSVLLLRSITEQHVHSGWPPT